MWRRHGAGGEAPAMVYAGDSIPRGLVGDLLIIYVGLYGRYADYRRLKNRRSDSGCLEGADSIQQRAHMRYWEMCRYLPMQG